MNNTFLMRRRERIPERTGNLDNLLSRKSPGGNYTIKRLPFDQLHGQEMDAIRFLDRVDGDNIGMVELRERLGLTTKTRQPLRILPHVGGQYFERHVASELGVGGAIYLAHAACPKRRKNLMLTESCAWGQSHVCAL